MTNTRAASLPIPLPVQRGWENLPAVALLTAAGLALRLARLGSSRSGGMRDIPFGSPPSRCGR
jgi:hypothetical protein